MPGSFLSFDVLPVRRAFGQAHVSANSCPALSLDSFQVRVVNKCFADRFEHFGRIPSRHHVGPWQSGTAGFHPHERCPQTGSDE